MSYEKEIRILVVDDEPNQRRAIRRTLAELGAALSESASGPEALESIRIFVPDLVILDIMMPQMDGYEVCRQIKSNPETAGIMVLLLSAKPDIADRLKGYEAGADDYMTKPYDPEELRAKCRILCRLKETRDQLAESEERFRGIAASATDAIIMLNDFGKVTYWNPAAERIFGYSSDEMMGHDLHRRVLKEDGYGRFKTGFQGFKESGGGPVIGGVREIPGLRKGGEEFPAEISVAALKLKGCWNAVGIVRDISERKEAEKQILEARHAADEANRAKGQFLASMSHEIRTPMNAIIGMTELALDTPLNKVQRDYMETVRNAGEALMRLLNDILDFSKMESKRVEMERVEFNIRESLGDFLKPVALSAHQKGLELAYHVSQSVPDIVLGDPSRLRQIVVNLVGNAIKFTDIGEVVVRVEKENVSEEHAILHFSVADTGVGISQDRQSRIFEPFTQADGSIARRYGGTGLGLAISKGLAELMGGRMWVEGGPGAGTIFHFTALFGLSEACSERSLASPPIQLKSLPILVADNNATNCQILKDMLEEWDMGPVGAASPAEVVEKLEEARRTGRPFAVALVDADLVLMTDSHMLEGILSEDDGITHTILMLTASSQIRARASAVEYERFVCVNKPIKPSELMDALMNALSVTVGESHGSEMGTQRSVHPGTVLRILLAEDNAVNRKLALIMLEKDGHEVTAVGNGSEAVHALFNNAYDLVLMDVQMPVMDGVEATKRIREMERKTGARVPIVALTANAMKGDRERYLEAGMDDYMAKPFKGDLLHEVIARNTGGGVLAK